MFTLYFKTKDDCDKNIIGQRIHEALQGSECYVNNDAILNIDFDNMVMLSIGDENTQNFEKTIDCTEWDMTELYKRYGLDEWDTADKFDEAT